MKWVMLFLLLPNFAEANPARKIIVKKDEVVTVRTAIGIATIIQVQDQPTSVVLGDSGAFKVEYLNQAITIKPLHGGATSNLYIHTDYDRYSVKLVTGPQASSDYVVYLKPFQEEKPTPTQRFQTMRWKVMNITKKSSLGAITLKRFGKTQGVLYFELEFVPVKDGRLDPGIFWFTQGLDTRPISDLFISSLEQKKGKAVTATLSIKRTDLKPATPGAIEIRAKDRLKFSFTKEALWND